MIPPDLGKGQGFEESYLSLGLQEKLKADVHVNERCPFTFPTASSWTYSYILLENTDIIPEFHIIM